MLSKTLMGALILLASGTAMAGHYDRDYGRRVSVEPSFSFSYSSGRQYDGYRAHYRTGGDHYRTHRYHPREVVYVGRPVTIKHVYHNDYYRKDFYRGHPGRHHGWENRHDRRDGRYDHRSHH